jgi:heme-degrading monooxygenase HmoA
MSSSQNIIKYVKHNKVRLKTGETREKTSRVFFEFFKEIEKKTTGMKGFMIMDDLQDQQESIVLTFWERKEDMDSFYKSDNRLLGNLVERLKPSFEQMPVRKDYQVSDVKVW